MSETNVLNTVAGSLAPNAVELSTPPHKAEPASLKITPTSSVSFSKNGKFLLTGSEDHFVRIWDVVSGVIIHQIEHKRPVSCVCFDDSDYDEHVLEFKVATGCWDKIARVFRLPYTKGKQPNVNDHELILETEEHGDTVMGVCFRPRTPGSQGSCILTGSRDNFARVFKFDSKVSATNCKPSLQTVPHGNYVQSVCFSTDGNMFATGSYDRIARIFDVTDSQIFDRPKMTDFANVLSTNPAQHGSFVTDVCFSHDGRYLATGCADKFARVFAVNFEKKDLLEVLKTIKHDQIINCVCFPSYATKQQQNEAGIIATGCMDGLVRIFDITTGKQILDTGSSWPKMLSLNASQQKQLQNGIDKKKVDKRTGITSFSFSKDLFSKDGSIATGHKDGSICIFKVSHKDEDYKTMEIESAGGNEQFGQIFFFSFFPDGKQILVLVFDKTITDKKTPPTPISIALKASVFHKEGEKWTERTPVLIEVPCIWTPFTPKELFSKLSICVSPDAEMKWIAAAAPSPSDCLKPGFVMIFERRTGKKHEINVHHGLLPSSVCFFFNEEENTFLFASAATSNNFSIHGYNQRQQEVWMQKFPVNRSSRSDGTKTEEKEYSISSMCFVDGKNIVASCFYGPNDGIVRILDIDEAKDGFKHLETTKHERSIVSMCCTNRKAAGDPVLTGTGCQDKRARVFKIEQKNGSSQAVAIMKTVPCEYAAKTVCFSPDERFLLAGFWDGVARFFSTLENADDVPPIMVFQCDDQNPRVAWSSCNFAINHVAFCSKSKSNTLRVLPVHENFGLDALLPVTKLYLLEWGRQSEDVQKQCSLFSESHVLAREFFTPGKESGLVALAKHWKKRDPEFTSILSTLKRIFKNATNSGAVIMNAGYILEALFDNLEATEDKNSPKDHQEKKEDEGSINAMLFKELPRVVELLLQNVVRHSHFILRDSEITNQLVRMTSKSAGFAFLAPAINEFWTDLVKLTESNRIVIHNVEQVKFSETSYLYVAGSESIAEPVFEQFFKEHKQPSGGVSVDFERLLVPIPDAARISRTANDPCCWTENVISSNEKDSLLQSLVNLQNIDNFGGDVAQAIVKFKWNSYAEKLFLVQFIVYILGLAFLVAISMLTWANSYPKPFSLTFYYSPQAILSYVYWGIIVYTAMRELAQFRRTPFDENFCKFNWLDKLCCCGIRWGLYLRHLLFHLYDFWNFLDLLHIFFGCWSVIAIWSQSQWSLPILAITSYLRWYGVLFYLQVPFFSAEHSLFTHLSSLPSTTLTAIKLCCRSKRKPSAGISQHRSLCSHTL
jgi:WD40 repeat protein